MRPFDILGSSLQDFSAQMAIIDTNREERRRLKMERSLDDSISDAYEQVDQTAECMEFPK